MPVFFLLFMAYGKGGRCGKGGHRGSPFPNEFSLPLYDSGKEKQMGAPVNTILASLKE